MNLIYKIAFAIFGRRVRGKAEAYAETRVMLEQAHIPLTWDMYVSTTYLYAHLLGIIGAFLGYLIAPLIYRLCKTVMDSSQFVSPVDLESISGYWEVASAVILTILIATLLGAISYYMMLMYPYLIATTRKTKIDLTLPHVVAYMHALSKGGMNLIAIFESLSEQTNVYGEAAEEIAYIVMDTKYHGTDLLTALKTAAVRTRSEKFRDFLDNLISVAETGGDTESFFGGMVDHYQRSAAADQSSYLEMLAMVAETYITVFVAGPLFLITILIVMGMMGPGSLLALRLVIYVMIPISAAAFAVLLSIISIGSDTNMIKIYTETRRIRQYDDVRTRIIEDDERMVRRLMRSLRWTSVIKSSKTPLKPFYSEPSRTLYLCVPAALLILGYTAYYGGGLTIDRLDDAVVAGLLIVLVPYLFFYEMQRRRIRQIEDSVPGFLRKLAVVNDVGMPLTAAIKSVSEVNLGVLSTEVKLMRKDMEWSHSIADSLIKFEQRVRTIAISRIVTLITKASESTGNIKETLRIAASDAALAERLRREKFASMFSYLVIVYLSFAVFLLVLYVFATMFIPMVPTGGGGGGMLSLDANESEYTMLFMHAAMIQGFFSGIIAGQMTGESACTGLKHAVTMLVAAYLLFTVFIG
ncbi:MAG: type II secretion system F family protein [Methanosarcinales archaeon]|nr:type II secretion system F family protein [Methanosarcinales archaeon]